MATRFPGGDSSFFTLRPEEATRLEKRRKAVSEYQPPKWRSNYPDPVSGQYVEYPMVEHASILASYCKLYANEQSGLHAYFIVCS